MQNKNMEKVFLVFFTSFGIQESYISQLSNVLKVNISPQS